MRHALKRDNLYERETMYHSLIRLSLIFALVTPLIQAQRKQPPQDNSTPLTAKQIARRVLPGVVLVETPCGRGRVMFGSGFVVDKGLVATNKHVVECGDESFVMLIGQNNKHRITAKYLDSTHDLALLRVEGLGASALPLSDAQNLSVGDKVYAAGNPQGLEGTFSDGIISSLRYNAGRIQFTAAISPGSSGGPVVDESGRVIGITVSSREGGQNLNFAVPTVFLKTLVADVRSGKAKNMIAAKSLAVPATIPMRRAGALGYTLIIDNSKTLKKQLVFIKRVARSLVEQSARDDGAKIVSFGWRGERQIERFMTDRQRLLNSVEAIESRGDGWTAPVIDALYWTLEKVRQEERPLETANGIVVLTHGMDNVSEKTWDDLIAFARAHKVPVYCVLFAPDSPDWDAIPDMSERLNRIKAWMERQRSSEQALRALTQETGGRLFVLKDEEQLTQFADQIVRALRASGRS
jgi:S1-C subfamily serine protease